MSDFESIIASHPLISIVQTINSDKSTVFIVKYLMDSKYYVLKAFPHGAAAHESYQREKRFCSSLAHPNIIQSIPNNQLLKLEETLPCNIVSMQYAPHGNFFNLVLDYGLADQKLVRTYFHQLIEGLEYLHSNKIAHLDLKLENLLLGEDFMLKISDFDLAHEITENPYTISNGGTANYRAPEVLSGTCVDYKAADIYAAGICLYTLTTSSFPFMEEKNGGQITLFRYESFIEENEEFWRENEELMDGKIQFSQAFKDLVNKMWEKDPSRRITLEQIKESRWYNDSIYTPVELKDKMQKLLGY